MAEGARSLALAGALLVRTLAQFAALGKCRPKPNMSFSGIEEWFPTNNAYLDMSQPSYRYQPSSSSLKKFVSGADGGRHRTVKNHNYVHKKYRAIDSHVMGFRKNSFYVCTH